MAVVQFCDCNSFDSLSLDFLYRTRKNLKNPMSIQFNPFNENLLERLSLHENKFLFVIKCSIIIPLCNAIKCHEYVSCH